MPLIRPLVLGRRAFRAAIASKTVVQIRILVSDDATLEFRHPQALLLAALTSRTRAFIAVRGCGDARVAEVVRHGVRDAAPRCAVTTVRSCSTVFNIIARRRVGVGWRVAFVLEYTAA
jgi:hypothetical protein